MMKSKSHRKPLVGVGLLARAECFLRREKQRQSWQAWQARGRVRIRRGGEELVQVGPRRVQVQHIRDEAKFAKDCDRLVAYLAGVYTASQVACAKAMRMTRGVWSNFLAEATWRLPLWEDDDGAIGLVRLTKRNRLR